jgi:VWFA-related protein
LNGRRRQCCAPPALLATVLLLIAAVPLSAAPPPAAVSPAAPPPAAAGPDPTPPPPSPCRLELLAPSEDHLAYGPTELRAEVSCPAHRSARSVTFLVDGRTVAEVGAPPWSATWDAGGSFAAHLVEARLLDSAGRGASVVRATPGSSLNEAVRVSSTPIDRVDLSVTVTDRDGHFVHGLTRDDFRVEEGGKERRILAVRPERRPLGLAVVLDASSSTAALWGPLRAAAPALARTLGPQDAAKVIAFNGPAYLVQDFTRDAAAIEASLARFRNWGGGTSLYDTLAAIGVELAWGRGGRRAVVLLTDGVDTLSRIDAGRLRNYLMRTDVTIETFLLRPQGASAQPGYGRFVRDIERLSRDTGGTVRRLQRGGADLDQAFRAVGEELQNRYQITYLSEAPSGREGVRSLEVRTRHKGLRVRARTGAVANRDIADYLMEDLRDGDLAARRKAAEWLGTLDAAQAADPLLAALADPTVEVRAAAITALGRLREPRAVDPIVAFLGDPDESVRRAASGALQAFGPAAVPQLAATLQTGEREARIKALTALAAIGGAASFEAIRAAAAPPPPLLREDADGDAARPALAAADPRVRAWALWALGRIGRPEGLPLLVQASIDREPRVRQAALRALGEIGAVEAIPILLHAAGSAVEDAPDGGRAEDPPPGDPDDRGAALEGLIAALGSTTRAGLLRGWAVTPGNAPVFLACVQRALSEGGATGEAMVAAAGGSGEVLAILAAIGDGAPAALSARARDLAARLRAAPPAELSARQAQPIW